jgi:multisubunit Na+/H+ antiporter MnhC subunit
MPTIGWEIIHEHEEIAEKLALLLYVLGLLSVVALYLNYKKNTKEKLVSFFILGIGIASLFVVQKVGTSGGEIRHTEIREGSQNTSAEKIDKDLDEK